MAVHHEHWRESYFFDLHDPSGVGDVVFFTFAHYPARGHMDSLQMGRIGGEPVIGFLDRPDGDDPLTTALAGRVGGDRAAVAGGAAAAPIPRCRTSASTSRSPRAPSPTACGGARCAPADDVVWDQCHTLQSGHLPRHVHRRAA